MNLSTFFLFELLLGIRFSNAIPVGPLEEQDVEGTSTTIPHRLTFLPSHEILK